MKSKWQLALGLLVGAVLLMSAISVVGQQKPTAGNKVIIEKTLQGPDDPKGPPVDNMFMFITSEMNFDGKLVKGAPYSAEGVTETTQTLSDGNRIINKSTSTIYRDSEGRTRRELTLRSIGPFANSEEPAQTISINDPVAGVNYSLDPRTHEAHKMMPMRFEFKIATPPGGEVHAVGPEGAGSRVRIERSEMKSQVLQSEVKSQVLMRNGTAAPPVAVNGGTVMEYEYHGSLDAKRNAKTESLGKQSMEGVEAEGNRTTITIPAGEMGNERSIEIVSERWYSPELQVDVMTRHSDPRFGETIYRLTNINRSEPAKSLFEVPADYTIKVTPNQKMRMMKKPTEDLQ